jgi:hypothetical protein
VASRQLAEVYWLPSEIPDLGRSSLQHFDLEDVDFHGFTSRDVDGSDHPAISQADHQQPGPIAVGAASIHARVHSGISPAPKPIRCAMKDSRGTSE